MSSLDMKTPTIFLANSGIDEPTAMKVAPITLGEYFCSIRIYI